MDSDRRAEGWYLDPFRIHEQRWMSDGRPTSLVKDAGVEAKDEPPDQSLPDPIVPAPIQEAILGGDLLRADDVDKGPTPDNSDYMESAFVGNAVFNNPMTAGVLNAGTRDGLMFETPFQRKLGQRARRARWSKRWQKLFGGSQPGRP